MANSKRRENYTDRNGNMFIPMNVEGAQMNHFITTPKLILIVLMGLTLFFLITQLNGASIAQYIIWIGLYAIVCIQLTRFFIFEEKFYYRMYKELQEHEVTSPALFWDVASIDDTDDGAILTYSDAKIAIVVRVERDTITGKSGDFRETHYDAISDFYKYVVSNKYSFVQMNVMEQAGKDARLVELGKIVNKSDNPNIRKLMEFQVGHIKNITRASLIESDYFLFYTNDISKIDSIISDISDCIFTLLDGAYIGYQVLTARDIVDLVKDLYGVNYFNSTEASLLMFDKSVARSVVPFVVSGIQWDDGEEQSLTENEKFKLRNITSSSIKDELRIEDGTVKSAIYRKEERGSIGIQFNELSNVQQKSKYIQRKPKAQKPQNKISLEKSEPVHNNEPIEKDKLINNFKNETDIGQEQFIVDSNSSDTSDDEYIDF